jgi:hypothetical protein
MKKILICMVVSFLANFAIGQLSVTKIPIVLNREYCENCLENKPAFQFNTMPKGILEAGLLNPLALEETESPTPRYRQFIEFGDGYFSNNFSGSFVQRQLASVNDGGNYTPLVITYGIYTPKPPTIISDFTAINRINGDDVIVKQEKIVDPNKIVSVVPSINSAIPSDLMTFAIPFKRKDGSVKNGVLIFLYNNRNAANELFMPHTQNQKISWITNEVGNTTSIVSIRGLGINNTFTAKEISSINPSIQSLIENADQEYSNSIVIDIENITDDLEHNIFISLQTNDARRLDGLDERSNVNIKAIFVPFDKNVSDPNSPRNYYFNESENTFTETLNYSPQAHDPNNTSIKPTCVKTGSQNQKLTFTMNISNEGKADVKTVWLRPRFFNGAMLRLKNIEIVKAIIGGKDRKAALKNGMQNTTIDSAAMPGKHGYFCINFDSLTGVGTSFSYWDTVSGSKVLLKGIPAGQTADNYDSNIVSAEIIFTADIVTVPDNPGSDSLIADVCFDSRIGGMLPIYSTPRPGGVTIATNCTETNSTDDCTSFWCKYWWLILLFLLALIVLLFYLKRNRPH